MLRRVERSLAVRVREPIEDRHAVQFGSRNGDQRAEVFVLDLHERVTVPAQQAEDAQIVGNAGRVAAQAREARLAGVGGRDMRGPAAEAARSGSDVGRGSLHQPIDAVAARCETFGEDGLRRGAKGREEIRRDEQDI